MKSGKTKRVQTYPQPTEDAALIGKTAIIHCVRPNFHLDGLTFTITKIQRGKHKHGCGKRLKKQFKVLQAMGPTCCMRSF